MATVHTAETLALVQKLNDENGGYYHIECGVMPRSGRDLPLFWLSYDCVNGPGSTSSVFADFITAENLPRRFDEAIQRIENGIALADADERTMRYAQ